MTRGFRSVVSVCALFAVLRTAKTSTPCETAEECETAVGLGSTCREDGVCSNPFVQGCLQRLLPGWTKKRVCDSNDPPQAATLGLCRETEFDYLEVRILSRNWESAFFESWLLQILLSEMLDVPATIETGTPDAVVDFYDPKARFEYGLANDFHSLETSHQLGDCRRASRDPDNYESCSHFVPELWLASHAIEIQSYIDRGIMETPQALGALGQNGWFIPKFTAERNPAFLSSFGMQGEENRRKLAETFLRPTTWKDYCELVSLDGCETNDRIAARAPQDETEGARMFVDGVYTGHFRETDKNNCDKHPTNCTGHIADYPCEWGGFLKPQTYHLGIALESDGPGSEGGYSYGELVDIWKAANATKSDVIMLWWTPESLYQFFQGTDAEFIRVTLPPPTQACVEARIVQDAKCSGNFTASVGDPLGSCDDTPNVLQTIAGTSLFDVTYDSSIPEALRSPAFEALNLFRISTLQLGELFDYWRRLPTPREAVCQWAVEKMDFMRSFVPRNYPRVIEEANKWTALAVVATVLGSIATLLVLLTSGMVHKQRNRRVMVVSQVEFLRLLLAGLLLIAIGAIVVAMPSTNGSCVASAWLINIGYTLELIPLIVKVAAINRLMNAARSMRRVQVSRTSLFGAVYFLLAVVVVFLICWTAIDPPQRDAEYDLSDDLTEDGESIVTVRYFCSSDSDAWAFVGLAWNALLLLSASVLAFQTRNIRQDFNESRILAMMIYSHFFFVVLRIVVFFLSDSVSNESLNRATSIIFSVDTIATICIYFVPKIFGADDPTGRARNKGVRFSSHFQNQSPAGPAFGKSSSTSSQTNSIPDPELANQARRGAPTETTVTFSSATSMRGSQRLSGSFTCKRCGSTCSFDSSRDELRPLNTAEGNDARDDDPMEETHPDKVEGDGDNASEGKDTSGDDVPKEETYPVPVLSGGNEGNDKIEESG